MSEATQSSPPSTVVRTFAPLVLGLLAATGLLIWGSAGEKTDFGVLAFGDETALVYGQVDERPIHCCDMHELQPCLDAWRARGGKQVVLWLGNSQLHGLNQAKPGQQVAPELLHPAVAASGLDVLSVSPCNGAPQEHYVILEHMLAKVPLKAVVVEVCFDDFRELGLRDNIREVALADEDTRQGLDSTAVGRDLLEQYSTASDEFEGELAGLSGTVQKQVEGALNGVLENHFTLWDRRSEARGRIRVGLMRIRNTIFGITPQTTRKMLRPRYISNLDALTSLAERAAACDIEVLLYVAPIRDDVALPYDQEEYSAFKSDLAELADSTGATLANLESLVPAQHWGTKDNTTLNAKSELDFMHFQYGGHELLAEAVSELLDDLGCAESSVTVATRPGQTDLN